MTCRGKDCVLPESVLKGQRLLLCFIESGSVRHVPFKVVNIVIGFVSHQSDVTTGGHLVNRQLLSASDRLSELPVSLSIQLVGP